MDTKLTPGMKAVVTQMLQAEYLRTAGDHVAENAALAELEDLCDTLSLSELFVALRHVATTLQQKVVTH